MPIYEFEHVIRLATSQKTALAKAITNWHATKFKAPRFIVTCRFIDVSQGPLSETYIGGEPRKINSLFVSLRSGSGRTPEQLESMTHEVVSIWSDIVGSTKEAQLRAVYLKGTLDSALEAGVMLPMVCALDISNLILTSFNSLGSLNSGLKKIWRSSRSWQLLAMKILLA